ncbi:unnamed protein product [Acanthoscelides obtectus]|uniref:Uncharacterized protein n=1 Tax=Acanthoscelides obtectus TaxID=200917 RepID=A0A9P0Q623_ACAOB|nr:unnamed protein product [Acanthoscelides obtectus]CAK1668347.1 hypothetical protein AOBTE_LOCUS26339 [Acanthoscelides obtectus]
MSVKNKYFQTCITPHFLARHCKHFSKQFGNNNSHLF